MQGDDSAGPGPETVRFEAQARSAGLVLPVPRRVNPSVALVVAAVICVASLGIGYGFGWFNPHSATVGYSHPAGCSTPVATLNGSVTGSSTASANATFAALATNYTTSSGGCIAFHLVPQGSSDVGPALSAPGSSFAVSGAPLTPAEEAALPDGVDVVPLVLGAIAVIYDLPGVPALNLTPVALAGLYLGSVTSWNDSTIRSSNAGAALGGQSPPTPVHESGSSGATAAFTEFLSRANATWGAREGAGATVAWPAGVAANGPTGILTYVETHPGSLGYVPLPESVGPSVAVAAIQDAAGAMVLPSAAAASSAGQSAAFQGAAANQSWASVDWGNATNPVAYPIEQLGYVVVFQDLGVAYGGHLSLYDSWWLLTFCEWVINAGQALATGGGFSALPVSLASLDGSFLSEISYNGTSVLTGPSEEGSEPGGETGEF